MSDNYNYQPGDVANDHFLGTNGHWRPVSSGVGVPQYSLYPPYPQYPPKSKTASVLLAIFFSFFAWLYTYRKDAAKFWISFIVYFSSFFFGFFFFPLWFIGVFLWFWAILDTAVKPQEWYMTYWMTN
jgi:hypothetical protein